jgi:hypothetical protein
MNTTPEPPVPDVAQPQLPPQQAAPMPEARLREPLRLALFALGIGFALDVMFQGGAVGVGINVPIAVVLFLTCLTFLAKREAAAFRKGAIGLFLPPLLFFATMLAVRANPTLTFYNLSACGIITLLLLHFRGDGNPFTASFGGWLALPWRALGGTLATAPSTLKSAGSQIAVSGNGRERYAAIGRGVLLAIPTLVVFTALFANADAVFAKQISELTTWLFPANIGLHSSRLIWIVTATFLTTGGLAYSLTRRETRVAAQEKPSKSMLGITEAGIVLGTVSALFGAFLWTQTGYLFGGDAHVQTVPNLTYAEYARHGFAELNIVAVLTLALIGGLKAATKCETATHSRMFALLATALLTLTFPLLASAFSRMGAYEVAYGATELRLYVDVFMAWLAVGLFWCGVTLWKAIPGGIAVYVCAVGFLVSLNILNPDRDIARRNMQRYEKTGKIDREYLSSLSEDALPELVPLLTSAVPRDRHLVEQIAGRNRSDARYHGWQSWNLSRAQGRRLLQTFPRHTPPPVAPAPPQILGTR